MPKDEEDLRETCFFYCIKCDEEYSFLEDTEICPICGGEVDVIK